MTDHAKTLDQPIVFGEHQHLMGVVSHPVSQDDSNDDLAVIMLTPGMLHSAGPYRMHVELARYLSERHIRSLRFDLSGIGESLGVGSSGCSIDRAAAETRAAMDRMQQQFGCKRFILFGLCSGADDSVHTALQDERVAGFVVIDGCGFRTRRYHWHRLTTHYLPRVLSPAKWSSLLGRVLHGDDDVPSTLQAGSDVREFPSRDESAQQLQVLADRGTKMHFVYTSGVGEYYNHAGQFWEMFRDVQWNGNASTEHFDFMDHVALLCQDREQLITHVGDQIRQTVDQIHRSAAPMKSKDDERPILITFPGNELGTSVTV